jgi:hypothetical protein
MDTSIFVISLYCTDLWDITWATVGRRAWDNILLRSCLISSHVASGKQTPLKPHKLRQDSNAISVFLILYDSATLSHSLFTRTTSCSHTAYSRLWHGISLWSWSSSDPFSQGWSPVNWDSLDAGTDKWWKECIGDETALSTPPPTWLQAHKASQFRRR